MRSSTRRHAGLFALIVAAAMAGASPSSPAPGALGAAGPAAQRGLLPARSSTAVSPAPDTLPTRELVELGDRIFHGRAANGLCSVCHGKQGLGTYAGPSLADSVWLHGDGSYDALVAVITAGVEHPAHHRGRMIAAGGMPLTREQIRAVAAYVFSLRPRSGDRSPPFPAGP